MEAAEIWEWIDRVQDILTLIGVPIAIYLLWSVYRKVKKEEKSYFIAAVEIPWEGSYLQRFRTKEGAQAWIKESAERAALGVTGIVLGRLIEGDYPFYDELDGGIEWPNK